MYLIKFEKSAEDDLEKLLDEEAKLAVKLWRLIMNINHGHPYQGIGKPEELKHDYAGWWSRRITDKHRLVYKVEKDTLIILSCYGHYDD